MKRTTFVVTVTHELDESETRAMHNRIRSACEVRGAGMVEVTDLDPGLPHEEARRILAHTISLARTLPGREGEW